MHTKCFGCCGEEDNERVPRHSPHSDEFRKSSQASQRKSRMGSAAWCPLYRPPIPVPLRFLSVEDLTSLSVSPSSRFSHLKLLLWETPWVGAGSATGTTFPSLLMCSVMVAEQLRHSQKYSGLLGLDNLRAGSVCSRKSVPSSM